jgi:hypothetical protein
MGNVDIPFSEYATGQPLRLATPTEGPRSLVDARQAEPLVVST